MPAKRKKIDCDFTVRYAPLPPERAVAWRASVRWLVMVCVESIENGLLDDAPLPISERGNLGGDAASVDGLEHGAGTGSKLLQVKNNMHAFICVFRDTIESMGQAFDGMPAGKATPKVHFIGQ